MNTKQSKSAHNFINVNLLVEVTQTRRNSWKDLRIVGRKDFQDQIEVSIATSVPITPLAKELIFSVIVPNILYLGVDVCGRYVLINHMTW